MRASLALTVLAALLALGARAGAGTAEALTDLLVRPQGWSAFIETTPELRPTDRATKAGYQFFRRDGEVIGRTTGLAEGFNCEFKVRVRPQGSNSIPSPAPATTATATTRPTRSSISILRTARSRSSAWMRRRNGGCRPGRSPAVPLQIQPCTAISSTV
jgi:hypothetical protein